MPRRQRVPEADVGWPEAYLNSSFRFRLTYNLRRCKTYKDPEPDETMNSVLGRFVIVFSAVLALVPLTWAQQNPLGQPQGGVFNPPALKGEGGCSLTSNCADVAPGMIRSALGQSPLEENLRELTDRVGGRVTGSPAADDAVLWAVKAFREAGVDDVHVEKFMMPHGWSEGATSLEVLAPARFDVRLVSTGWSPAAPPGGITAPVVDVGAGDEAGFAKAGQAIRGSIILVHSNILETYEQLADEYVEGVAIVSRAQEVGAAAIFWMSSRPNRLLYRHILSLNGDPEPLPQAILAREDAERIARFLAHGQVVQVHFDMPNRVTGPVESENVVAEIHGREKPDEFVLLGAHLDSWELGTGALDNGCNAALVIDAARVIHSSGVQPRRSIRFVLFTGEEQGMLGSAAYARAHEAEMDKMIAAIVYDSGSGRVTDYSISGRKDIQAALGEDLKPVQTLHPVNVTLDAELGTDNFDFLLEGIPTLVADQEPANYMLNYHAESDTFDKVDMAEVKNNVAIAAVTAYAIADAPGRLGERQSRVEIQQLLNDTGLAAQMKSLGFLPQWLSGARGRSQ
jgi:carboxypeptidase Q